MRIISGTAKGRILKTPQGKSTRPTSAMVREAVFGIIGSHIQGAVVLDLFCGSGALAMEALSRGAAGAVLIDADPKACAVARANASELGFTACEIYRNDYLRALDILRRKCKRFDIVFLDPPYGQQKYYIKALEGLRGMLGNGGLVVCEHDAKDTITASGYDAIKTTRYGSKSISIFTEDKNENSHLPR